MPVSMRLERVVITVALAGMLTPAARVSVAKTTCHYFRDRGRGEREASTEREREVEMEREREREREQVGGGFVSHMR